MRESRGAAQLFERALREATRDDLIEYIRKCAIWRVADAAHDLFMIAWNRESQAHLQLLDEATNDRMPEKPTTRALADWYARTVEREAKISRRERSADRLFKQAQRAREAIRW